jgi:hypothetical protein
MSQWIPVDERLPPEETRLLAYDGDKVFESEYWNGNWEWCADVTHWMPLPEPPEVTQSAADADAEIDRLRLTDEERQAIAWVCGDLADITGPTYETLRGLLERTK